MEEKRMAGDYEIMAAVSIGYKEIIFGVNEKDTKGHKYMCTYGEKNDLFELFNDAVGSDDYLEIIEIFGERIAKESKKVSEKINSTGIPYNVITKTDCILDKRGQDINGKVIAINSEILKPEFQRSEYQLYIVTGGFGASGIARGTAVFCKNIYDGEINRFARTDVIGEVKPECMPEWAKKKFQEMK